VIRLTSRGQLAEELWTSYAPGPYLWITRRSWRPLFPPLFRLGLGYRIQFHGWTSHRDWLLAVADRVDEVLRKSPAA
jgi:hypothetical protein